MKQGLALAISLAVALPLPVPSTVAASAAVEGGRKKKAPDLEKIVKTLSNLMKRRKLGKKDPERIADKIEPLDEQGLSWVLDRLALVEGKGRGDAAPLVETQLRDRLLGMRYGKGILKLPNAWERMADADPAARDRLLSDLSRLEDPEPATRFALWVLSGGETRVRLRALDTVADLLSWGGDSERLLPALHKALEDPSPAVRDLALERLVNLSDTKALDWALDHLGAPEKETTTVRERSEERCPGDRALLLLAHYSKSHLDLEPDEYRKMTEDERKAVETEFRAWRKKGGANPLRNGNDGPFDPVPKVTTRIVKPDAAREVQVRWWSEIDRASFQMTLEELDVVASSTVDYTTTFRLYVIASGARQGSWEAFARRVRCGERYRLPRKGFGLIETSVQPLLDGRWKVWVLAYESR
ncbi:MAG: HEAT repeat domain-containing protein [Planctomycetota bacterium]|jgi:hypothetical protein